MEDVVSAARTPPVAHLRRRIRHFFKAHFDELLETHAIIWVELLISIFCPRFFSKFRDSALVEPEVVRRALAEPS